MSWSGSICDQPIAYKAAGSGHQAVVNLSIGDSDLSSVAVAQAACVTNQATKSICDRVFAANASRGFQIGSNMGGTFSSSKTTYFASLPTNNNQSQMIQG